MRQIFRLVYLTDPAVPGLARGNHSVEVGAGAVVHVVPITLQVQKVLAIVAPVRFELSGKWCGTGTAIGCN